MQSENAKDESDAILGQSEISRPARWQVFALNALLLFPWFLCGILGFLSMILGGSIDFRNLYTAGFMLRTGHGHEIYDSLAQMRFQNELVSYADLPLPFIRPAYQALLLVPFSFLPFRLAYCAFYVFNLAVLSLGFRLLRPYLLKLECIASYLPAVMLLFLPINVALASGQDSIVLFTLLAGALACIDGDREFLAGVLAALGLFKFQLVIPIALLFLVWRRWRFSAGFACAGAVLAGISTWIVGPEQEVHYIRLMTQLGHSFGFGPRFPLPIGKMANLHGALYGILGESPLAVPLTIGASAAMMIFVVILRPRGSNALVTAIPVAALVSYYMVAYDMSVLIIPLVVVFSHLAQAKDKISTVGRIQLIAATLLFVFPVLVLVSNLLFWTVSIPLLAFAITAALHLESNTSSIVAGAGPA